MWMRCRKRVRDGAAGGGSGEGVETGGETGGEAGICGADTAGGSTGGTACGIGGTGGVWGTCGGGDALGGGITEATPPDVKPMKEASNPGSAAERRAGATGRNNCSARCRTSEGSSHGLTGSISGAGKWQLRGILPAWLALPREENRRRFPRLSRLPALRRAALSRWRG